jgi:hypothetical protein
MDRIREKIREGIERTGASEYRLSLQLGKNEAYINQFLAGKQKTLPYEVRAKLAELLAMSPEEFDVGPTSAPPRQMGVEEDAEPYTPAAGSYLSASPSIGFFRMRSRALDQHPERIMPGHLLAFDINKVNVAQIPSDTVVVAQRMDRRELLKSHGTVVRIFIAPNKLITNSSEANEIVSLDDESLPYVVVIRGALLSVVRELS